MKRQSKATQPFRTDDAMDEESRGGFVQFGVRLPAADDADGKTPSNAADDVAGILGERRNGLRRQLRSFRVMSAPYFREDRHGRVLFAIMVVLTLLNSAVRVYFSYLARDFWSALSDKDVDKFYAIMTNFVGSMVLLAPINVAYRFQRQKLAIAWREWMTQRVLRLYFTNKVYYALERQAGVAKAENLNETIDFNAETKEIDNPDQRIAEDIRSFTEFSLSFFLTLVTSVIDLVAFSYILFSIMPQLFLAIFLFASIGTILTICIGKVLIHLNYESLQREANFRFSLVRVRENAESIAFYAGETVEERETGRRFAHVIDNMTMVNVAQRNLDFFTTFYNYLTWVLPIIVVAPEYFTGNVALGVIQQASSAFSHILDDFSIVVNSFTDISMFSAGIDRLFSFMNAIMELDPGRSMGSLLSMTEPGKAASIPESSASVAAITNKAAGTILVKEFNPFLADSSPASASQPPTMLFIRSLCLATPDNKRILAQNLNISLSKGSNLLIVGPSGSGKSSLLRVIAGLWNTGSGEIRRPVKEHVYFLPQRPYCPPGTLRDQLLYPSTEHGDGHSRTGSEPARQRSDWGPGAKDGSRLWSDEDLLNVLKKVDLPHLASRAGGGDPHLGLNAVLDWSNTLSLGEQQRLAFGRLIINCPALVVMDESTSALDVLAEKKMYALLKEISKEAGRGLTYVSVGHRPTLLAHHNLKLSMRDNTGYVSDIPSYASATDEGFLLS